LNVYKLTLDKRKPFINQVSRSVLFLLFRVVNFFVWFVHVDLIGYVPFAGAPLEEVVKYSDTVGFLHDPVVFELVVLCHLDHVVLHVLVYVLAKKIHV
jgi:hypothetical protein